MLSLVGRLTRVLPYGTKRLGSVRQLTNNDGEVVLARSYDPYGNTLQSFGAGQTVYGFTGETTDANGLIYLRARHYAPGMGRFLTRDTWPGESNRPLSLNRWGYVEGNPVNFVDPTGMITCKDSSNKVCMSKANQLKVEARIIKQNVKNGVTKPVEGFAKLVDLAQDSFVDINGIMWGLTIDIYQS